MVIAMSDTTLADEYETLRNHKAIDVAVPPHIENNLASRFDLREYQQEAISNFEHHLDSNPRSERDSPINLLYEMATGSGKTLVMAANILELYRRGYRNFVFLVNSRDIVEKTRANFIDSSASKYLFDNELRVDGRDVSIKLVENFAAVSSSDKHINLHLTTVQGLHTSLNTPRENSLTYEEFSGRETVFLADEAHHLNAITKSDSQRTKTDEREITAWEETVDKLLQSNPNNVLLEYTATANLDDKSLFQKYSDKLIYQYSLREFRRDRYSKEVNVLESDSNPIERAIEAVVLSQYRRKVAEESVVNADTSGIFKPVILMQSSSIKESERYEQEFRNLVKQLSGNDLEEIRKNSGKTLQQAFEYFESNDISMEKLAEEIRVEFSGERVISINNKNDNERKQRQVNSLEDRENKVRVVFTVQKLNEGWDVLNLFDIVKLHDNGGSSTSGPSKTTTREAQLIGRGARYCPFQSDENQEMYRRKYDDDLDNDSRVLEELYYHSDHKPDYISELKTALENEGVIESGEETTDVSLRVQDEFRQSQFWESGKIFVNEQDTSKKPVENLNELGQELYSHDLKSHNSHEYRLFKEQSKATHSKKTRRYSLLELGENVVRKAIREIEFYAYDTLQAHVQVDSISEFINSTEFLGGVEVEVSGPEDRIDELHQDQKLGIVRDILKTIREEIKSESTRETGTTQFYARDISDVVEDRTRRIRVDEAGEGERGRAMKDSNRSELRIDLSDKDWYVYNENYGTSQEKYLIKFLNDSIEKIREKYGDVYLLRNQKLFKIYEFSSGQAIEPDFVLFLTESETDEPLVYQLFIEPKGEGFISKDSWKEEFLKEIRDTCSIETIHETTEYELIGLPFYHEQERKRKFSSNLEDMLDIEKLF